MYIWGSLIREQDEHVTEFINGKDMYLFVLLIIDQLFADYSLFTCYHIKISLDFNLYIEVLKP